MSITRFLNDTMFEREFARCCDEYENLTFAVAWCGDPDRVTPFQHFSRIRGTINGLIGVGMCHTHPNAFPWLQSLKASIRVFRDQVALFHPKVYLFEQGPRYAVFIGSSNLTHAGFFQNIEANCLIEGQDEKGDISVLKGMIANWWADQNSFIPDSEWLKDYAARFERESSRRRKARIIGAGDRDDRVASANWLSRADWATYYTKVEQGLARCDNGGWGYFDVLVNAKKNIPTPWNRRYFREIDKRRLMGGLQPHGWLGHVAASGDVRRLLANGTTAELNQVVRSINAIAALQHPIEWNMLQKELVALTTLGPTMKVWGRFLCITRPDLYCTIASESVRKNLSATLQLSSDAIIKPAGYIELLKLLHGSPWFSAPTPSAERELQVWNHRMALLDAIFH